MAFQLPELNYKYDALEPYIDAQTMEIHHTKHHSTYTDKLNGAVKGTADEGKSIEDLLKDVSNKSIAIRNNGGGFYNHNFFWEILGPSKGMPSGEFLKAIETAFGSFDAFKVEFANAATTRFGSGWAWLIKQSDGSLTVTSTPNQDNPIMDISVVTGVPLLALDVWEHAYYLKYQNRRPEYIDAFWNVVNWTKVEDNFKRG
ncbi:superoxide dismutase [Marinilabiliaceae bacterium ANBcel2]|nr:superoxide dismutase [Marinilabiliaceae bacterium ANBcel2]